MATQFLCDYCRTVIDVESDDSLIVGVHRRVDEDEWADEDYASGETRTYRYCSQPHLAAHMERDPLPPIDLSDADEVDSRLEVISCSLVALILVGCTFYGFFAIIRDLL